MQILILVTCCAHRMAGLVGKDVFFGDWVAKWVDILLGTSDPVIALFPNSSFEFRVFFAEFNF